jgi:hypothetical protein
MSENPDSPSDNLLPNDLWNLTPYETVLRLQRQLELAFLQYKTQGDGGRNGAIEALNGLVDFFSITQRTWLERAYSIRS